MINSAFDENPCNYFSKLETDSPGTMMIMKKWYPTLVLMMVFMLGFGICSAEEPSTMPITLKENASEPYDDEIFLQLVTPVIDGLTNSRLNSSERMDVTSVYYSAASMKVSPDFYPVAENITRLLFYLVSSSESYEEVDKDSGLAIHNDEMRDSLKAQAKADLLAAEDAWRGLVMVYPNSTLFG